LQIEKKGLKRVEEQGGWGNYISSWWGGGGSGAEKSETKDIGEWQSVYNIFPITYVVLLMLTLFLQLRSLVTK